jgi:hypothetical protein
MKDINLPLKRFGTQEIKHFESIDLHNVYGDEFVDCRTFDSNLAERICVDLFDCLSKTSHPHSFRGDFVYGYKDVYYDQKTVKVVKKLKDGQVGPFFYIKYSNVGAKLFVQIAFKELDLIIGDMGKLDLKRDARLIAIRYKGEMTFDDMRYIDDIIRSLTYNSSGVKQSFCVRNKMSFIHFVNYLATHNVKRHSNLILFHEPVTWEQQKKWDVDIQGDVTNYRTYYKQTNYIVTTIDINKVNVYVDYIGYGGFKVNINTKPLDEDYINHPVDEIMGHLNELDDAIDVISGISNYKDLYGVLPWNECNNTNFEKFKFYKCMGREYPAETPYEKSLYEQL